MRMRRSIGGVMIHDALGGVIELIILIFSEEIRFITDLFSVITERVSPLGGVRLKVRMKI